MAFNGTGTTITFATGFLAEILNIVGPDMSRAEIDISHMTSDTDPTDGPFKPYLLGKLVEGGGVRVSIAFDPSVAPPIDSDPEQVSINWSDTDDSNASVWSFMGGMTGFTPTGVLEGRCTAEVTIKATGKITFA